MFNNLFDQKPSFITSGVTVLLGLALVLFPELSGKIFCSLLGACLLLFAILNLWTYVQNKNKQGIGVKSALVTTVISAFLAIICFTKAYIVLSFLPFVLGILLVAVSAVKIPFIISCIKNSVPGSGLFIASALVPLILGIIMLFNPFGVTRTVIMFFGVSLIINGIIDFSGAYYYKSSK